MPKVAWEMNLNTLLSIAGFAVMLLAGYRTSVAFETEITTWKAQITEQVTELKSERTNDVAQMRARADELSRDINALNVQDARQIEQIAAMLVYLQRIDRTLEALVKERNKP